MTTVVLEILYFKTWIVPSNISNNFVICSRHFSYCNTLYLAAEWMTQEPIITTEKCLRSSQISETVSVVLTWKIFDK